MSSERKKLVEVDHIKVQFGSRRHPFTAVDDVSFDIYEGETFGLVGESGSGKTTIGRSIIRINPVAEGEIRFDGKRISGKLSKEEDHQVTRDIQMIFQDPMSSLNERAKVGYIVAEGLYSPGHHLSEEERQAKVDQALRDVGLLPEFASRFPHEFSGGQRQRVGIARAMAVDPSFLVLDEPISALDVSIQAQVVNLLRRLREEQGLSMLFISHDLSMLRYISDRIAVMYLGTLVEVGPADEVCLSPAHPYTKALLASVPIPDPAEEARRVAAGKGARGELATPIDPGPGCRFCERCPFSSEECALKSPSLREVSPRHFCACLRV